METITTAFTTVEIGGHVLQVRRSKVGLKAPNDATPAGGPVEPARLPDEARRHTGSQFNRMRDTFRGPIRERSDR